MGTQPPPKKGAEPFLPVFGPFLWCPNGWMYQDGMEVGLSPGDFVLDGDPALPKKGAEPPIFGPCLLRLNGYDASKMPLNMQAGLSPGDFVLDGDPVPFPKMGRSPPPQFSANLYCDQTAACIKMPLGIERGLSPEDFVYDGTQPLPKKGAEPPIFGPCLLRPNGCMDQDATWYGGRPRPTLHCVQCGPRCPQKKGTPTATQFWPMSIVATVVHLSYC